MPLIKFIFRDQEDYDRRNIQNNYDLLWNQFKEAAIAAGSKNFHHLLNLD